MKARPILFSAPMIRALLAGRKAQTRRIVKMQTPKRRSLHDFSVGGVCVGRCPYGQPSDLLWVRETWCQPTSLDPGPTFYRADYPACVPKQFENVPPADQLVWKPSIHMERSASRITLRLTDVRVERLNDISEQDAIAEGLENSFIPGHGRIKGSWKVYTDERLGSLTAVGSYRSLWESINGKGSWDANPVVWALTFEVIQCNVDEVLRAAA